MKMTSKKWIALLMAMVLVFGLLAGCATTTTTETTTAAETTVAATETNSATEAITSNDVAETQETAPAESATIDPADIKIGYIVKTLGNTFWQTYESGARAAAEELGVQIDVRDVPTESDFKAQLDVALTMVNQDYDAIVAASITHPNLVPAIAAANEKGIPWIVVSEEQDAAVLEQSNAYVTAQCRLSFYDEGLVAGAYVADQLNGEGEVAIIEGMAGTSATRDRIAGFQDALAAFPGIEIVASQPADWMREEARDVTASMLQANPNIEAIYALNDTMALGVAVAVEQAGKIGEIIIVGDDGTEEAYQSIVNGQMSATIDGVAWQIAYYSVHAAVKAVVEDAETLPNYDLTPGLISIDNVQEALDVAPMPVGEMFDINENIYLPIAGIKE